MPEYTEHAPGTFCWSELATADQEGAKRFYTGVFGWEAEDVPVGVGQVYTVFRLRGKDVAAATTMGGQAEGAPPHWNAYVSVEDADMMAKTAESLGGKVLMEPFDVMDQGRMTVLQDPSGGVTMLWQPKAGIGAHLLGEPGALTWNELLTRDVDAARRFYTELFGWTAEDIDAGGGQTYTMFKKGDQSVGGLFPMGEQIPAEVPPYWSVCFEVDDADARVAKAKQLGGGVVVEPLDSGYGRYAVLRDDQGASFAIIKSATQPSQ